jgi:hypothetical protein
MVRISVIPDIMWKLFLTQASGDTAAEVLWRSDHVSALEMVTCQLRAAADLGQPSPTTVVSQSVATLFTVLSLIPTPPPPPLNQTGQLVSRQTFNHFHAHSIIKNLENVESSWNVIAHGDAREGKWRGNRRMEWVASTLPLYLGPWSIQHYCQH